MTPPAEIPPAPDSQELDLFPADDVLRRLPSATRGCTLALVSDAGQPAGPPPLPQLEHQARLLERMTDLRVVPLVLNTASAEKLITTTELLSPSFGVICLDNLGEETFEAAERLLGSLEGPVFFHPQQTRPILILAALERALARTGRSLEQVRLVLAGFESDSLQLVDYLLAAGARDLVICDRSGAVHKGRAGPTSWLTEQLAHKTNPYLVRGSLIRSLAGA
ncbi:MAG: hypothetical protein LBK52_06135, partial [Deltaproteobacteria bacterium]|nr:hypothetical protein [Deltaproteobacteria bacterium]